jgi:hypothetical protein
MAEFSANNSKETPTKTAGKTVGSKIAKFSQKWQKRGRKIFLQIFGGETIELLVFSWTLYRREKF